MYHLAAILLVHAATVSGADQVSPEAVTLKREVWDREESVQERYCVEILGEAVVKDVARSVCRCMRSIL